MSTEKAATVGDGDVGGDRASVEIVPAATVEDLLAASDLFDDPVREPWAQDFLARPGHHLLLARSHGRPVGFVSAVETAHPDKGVELFLYELGVDESVRGAGVGTALVEAIVELARALGCYGVWVPVDSDNEAALRTYRRAGGEPDGQPAVVVSWTFV